MLLLLDSARGMGRKRDFVDIHRDVEGDYILTIATPSVQ